MRSDPFKKGPLRPFDLYRFFDDQGELLYVGISLSVIQRISGHKSSQAWWKSVVRVEIEKLGEVTRDWALFEEKLAIKHEHPKHNVVHNRQDVEEGVAHHLGISRAALRRMIETSIPHV